MKYYLYILSFLLSANWISHAVCDCEAIKARNVELEDMMGKFIDVDSVKAIMVIYDNTVCEFTYKGTKREDIIRGIEREYCSSKAD